MVERLSPKPLIEKDPVWNLAGRCEWESDEIAGENQGLIVREVETDQPS
jgi:CYTH domain-containing protein